MQLRTLAIAVFGSACTTLGPIPATTGVAATPLGDTGGEFQIASVPGFNLSNAAARPGTGQSTNQLSLLFEPGPALSLPGVIAGVRAYGQANDIPVEPFLGYRVKLLPRLAMAAIGFGTRVHGEDRGSSYDASRLGGELAMDVNLGHSIHLQAAGSMTSVDATGSYCVDQRGFGTDCVSDPGLFDGSPPPPPAQVTASLHGTFPAGTGALVFDFSSYHHDDKGMAITRLRLALMAAVGEMPTLNNGMQGPNVSYTSLGVSLSFGVGAHSTPVVQPATPRPGP